MILITGSCGSIGSALCDKLISGVARLDIRESESIDIQDANEVDSIFTRYKPQLVIHTAANKYVDYLESRVEEAISINTLGTRNIIQACQKHRSRMLLVSTDKANNPVSILGYSKRAADIYTLLSGYSVIRLVNVYESAGNVVEIFKKQIATGGPVTVTDPRTTRYFISLDEACDAIIDASKISQGGDIFYVPGKLTYIIDLATNLIGNASIPIKITQPRPGDRIEEENPIPPFSIKVANNLWKSTHTSVLNAEQWIAPLLIERSKSMLIKLCQS